MALSILGFNVGIELLQLGVIALTVPWLIVLRRQPLYTYVRLSEQSSRALQRWPGWWSVSWNKPTQSPLD